MNRPFRLLVTGSRDWTDTVLLREVLDDIAVTACQAGATELVVVHGACYPSAERSSNVRPHRSADWLAQLWVTRLTHPLTVRPEPHPAAWTAPCRSTCRPGHRRERRSGSICPYAGKYRNQLMVDLGADLGVAFWLNQSSGTGDCISRMKRAGIRVRRAAINDSPIHES